MRVEVYSDFICPWCGIGHHRLAEALSRFEHAGETTVVRRSFQLDERAPVGVTEPVASMLAKKGFPPAQVAGMTARIEELARSEGIAPYIVGENRAGSTALAHELAAFAAREGKAEEAWSALYGAYFGEARSIFDVDSLAAIAGELGLDASAARAALRDRLFQDEVQADLKTARSLGVSGVPFFVFDGRLAVSGAQSVEVLLGALERAWATREAPALEVIEGEACTPSGCA